MIHYPLPLELTRDEFHTLVTDLYQELTRNGLNPALNMVIDDHDEVLGDGTTLTKFAILVSESAAKILEHKVRYHASTSNSAR